MAQEQSNAEQRTYWVIVEDHQSKLFSVFGPLSEDIEWTSKVRLARQHGRDVTSSTLACELDTKLMTSELMVMRRASFQSCEDGLQDSQI